jgi:hypothetical protein
MRRERTNGTAWRMAHFSLSTTAFTPVAFPWHDHVVVVVVGMNEQNAQPQQEEQNWILVVLYCNDDC